MPEKLVLSRKLAAGVFRGRIAAIYFSLIFHVLAFLIAVVIVRLFLPYPSRPLPSSLSFVFLPLEETSEMLALGVAQSEPAAAPPAGGRPARHALTTRLFSSQALPPDADVSDVQQELSEMTPLATGEPGPLPAVASPNPNYLPVADMTSALQSTYQFDSAYRRAFHRQELLGEQPELRMARLAIPEKQLTFLERKLDKLINRFENMIPADSILTWESGDQTYEVQYTHENAATPSDFDRINVHVSTEVDGKKWSTTVQMQRLAFSHFAQFVDFWDPRVAIHDDEFDGRFHTNTDFNFSNSKGIHPKFRGKVTTAGAIVQGNTEFPILPKDSIFIAGIETAVRAIKFPRRFVWQGAVPDSLALRFDEEAWIVFLPEGRVQWRTKSTAKSKTRRLPQLPFTIFGSKKARLHLRGLVRGKVLVAGESSIIIDGDVMYARPASLLRADDDFLGIVSQKNVEIAAPKITGAGDLHIHAAILAKGQFRVTNLFGAGHANLYIYGSLTAGSLTATEPRYATRIKFDRRLESKRPPNFPMTDRYEISSWDKKWKLESEKQR